LRVVLKLGGAGGGGGEKGKQRFPEAFLGDKNDKSGGGRVGSQKLQKQQGDAGRERGKERGFCDGSVAAAT
jgi:hypothetical protein